MERLSIDSVKVIVAGGGADDVDKWGRTPLMWSARKGLVDCVKILLDAKADVNAVDCNGETPLHWAAVNGHVDCMKCLIAHGANIKFQNTSGLSSLHLASMFGRFACVEELIRAGAELDGRDNLDYTPLDLAICDNHIGCMEILLDAGAKISNLGKKKMPDWFVALVAQRNRVKHTLIVLFALSRPLIGKDMAKMLIAAVWETRDLPEW